MPEISKLLRVDYKVDEYRTYYDTDDFIAASTKYLRAIENPSHPQYDPSFGAFIPTITPDDRLSFFSIERWTPDGYNGNEWAKMTEDVRATIESHMAHQGLKLGTDYYFMGTVPPNSPELDIELS